MKRFKELSARAKAGIFFGALLAAVLILVAVNGIKMKIRAAKRADMPTVVFTELAPETLELRKTLVTPEGNGDLRVTHQRREISEPEDVRGILELLDGAKLKALTPFADWMNENPDKVSDLHSPGVGVDLHVEGLSMQILINLEREESIARVCVISKGHDRPEEWVFSAGDEEGFRRLCDGLWEHEGGTVLQGSTYVHHAAAGE